MLEVSGWESLVIESSYLLKSFKYRSVIICINGGAILLLSRLIKKIDITDFHIL
jgi:hypothetical protein